MPRRTLVRGLRARLTLLAIGLLAVGLVAGAVIIVVALTYSLRHALDAGARRTARDVASFVNSGEGLPNPLPIGDGNTVAVQVVTAGNKVAGASAGTDRLVPLLRPGEVTQVRSGRTLQVSGERAGVDGTLRVLGQAAGPGDRPDTVIVAVYANQIGESGKVLTYVLLVGTPTLLVGMALLSWYLIGRTLRPVEDLRRGAEEVTGSQRLPVPPGEDEVHRLAVTLNTMLGRLDAVSARQRGFIADAAHELRSPLASLQTQLEVAQHLGERADWDRTAEGALIDITRLARLVEDLLLLARIDERRGAGEDRRSDVDVPAVVQEVASGYGHARVPVTVEEGGPATARADSDALRRVLRNLMDNAVRHAAGGVTVTASRYARSVVISVVDDGPGIPDEDRQRVFDRFTRLDDARSTDAGGTGLGLPIVRELVHAHGGTVSLADAGPGLRVTVTIPCRPTSS